MNIKQIIKDYFNFNDTEYKDFINVLTPEMKDILISKLDIMEKENNYLQGIQSFLSARGYY